MGKFKVGDKVRLVNPGAWYPKTALGTVLELRNNSAYKYYVLFEGGSQIPLAENEIRFDVEPNQYVGMDKSLEKKTKIQLVEIIENQKAEITKLVKEIEGLKNLKPAIAVQPVQAGQLVAVVKRTRPKVGEFVNFTQHELKPGDVINGYGVGNATVNSFQPFPFANDPQKYEATISYGATTNGCACMDYTWKVVSLVDAPKIPPLDPKKAWIKKGGFGTIGDGYGWHYKFTSDPQYNDCRGCWEVDVVVIEKDGRESNSYQSQSLGINWQPYTPEKPKTFWDQVKVGDKIKVSVAESYDGGRAYTGRIFKKEINVAKFIVDTATGSPIWKVGEVATVYPETLDVEILKD